MTGYVVLLKNWPQRKHIQWEKNRAQDGALGDPTAKGEWSRVVLRVWVDRETPARQLGLEPFKGIKVIFLTELPEGFTWELGSVIRADSVHVSPSRLSVRACLVMGLGLAALFFVVFCFHSRGHISPVLASNQLIGLATTHMHVSSLCTWRGPCAAHWFCVVSPLSLIVEQLFDFP